MKFVALLSGGLDSTVSAAIAARRGTGALALTFDYGQKSARAELDAARAVARFLRIPHRAIELGWMAGLGRATITRGGGPVPCFNRAGMLDDRRRTKRSAAAAWVPNRNGCFAGIAASFAEALKCDQIVAGFNREEAETFPDNSPAFVSAFNRSLARSTIFHPRLVSYTQSMDKKRIVEEGLEIPAPMNRIWSCYLGGRKMCGRCESCARTMRAFSAAGALEMLSGRMVLRGRRA